MANLAWVWGDMFQPNDVVCGLTEVGCDGDRCCCYFYFSSVLIQLLQRGYLAIVGIGWCHPGCALPVL